MKVLLVYVNYPEMYAQPVQRVCFSTLLRIGKVCPQNYANILRGVDSMPVLARKIILKCNIDMPSLRLLYSR